MSMIMNLFRVSNAELELFLADSNTLEGKVYDEETDGENPYLTDIDKSWDGIIYLLTGESTANTTSSLAKIFFSGQLIDAEQDLGYGPAQYLTPEQVKEINTEISKISISSLREKYDSTKMEKLEVYPNSWESEDSVDYLTDYFEIVQNVYSEATKNGEAIITFLN